MPESLSVCVLLVARVPQRVPLPNSFAGGSFRPSRPAGRIMRIYSSSPFMHKTYLCSLEGLSLRTDHRLWKLARECTVKAGFVGSADADVDEHRSHRRGSTRRICPLHSQASAAPSVCGSYPTSRRSRDFGV